MVSKRPFAVTVSKERAGFRPEPIEVRRRNSPVARSILWL